MAIHSYLRLSSRRDAFAFSMALLWFLLLPGTAFAETDLEANLESEAENGQPPPDRGEDEPEGEPEGDEAQKPHCPTFVPLEYRENPRQLSFYGVSCFEAGRYDWALSYYLSAFALAPNPLLQGTIGRSLHELGLYDPAMAHYQGFLSEERGTPRADRILERISQLEHEQQQDSASVSLQSSPPGAKVYLVLDNGDWFYIGETPTQVAMREGDYDFIFESDRHRLRQTSSRLRAGQTAELNEELVLNSAAHDISARSWRRAGGWTMAGSAPITAAGVTLMTLSFQKTRTARDLEDNFSDLSDYDARRRELLDDASSYRLWGTVSTVVGATGLLTGAVLFLVSRSPESSARESIDDAQARWDIQPIVGINKLGIRLHF